MTAFIVMTRPRRNKLFRTGEFSQLSLSKGTTMRMHTLMAGVTHGSATRSLPSAFC